MPSTHKKVIVRKRGRDSVSGYVSPANFVVEGKLELLNPAGKVVHIDMAEIKSVDFVRDFSDLTTTGRRTFTTRPRTEGLWVRLRFTDNDILEGVMPNDLVQIAPEGYGTGDVVYGGRQIAISSAKARSFLIPRFARNDNSSFGRVVWSWQASLRL